MKTIIRKSSYWEAGTVLAAFFLKEAGVMVPGLLLLVAVLAESWLSW